MRYEGKEDLENILGSLGVILMFFVAIGRGAVNFKLSTGQKVGNVPLRESESGRYTRSR